MALHFLFWLTTVTVLLTFLGKSMAEVVPVLSEPDHFLIQFRPDASPSDKDNFNQHLDDVLLHTPPNFHFKGTLQSYQFASFSGLYVNLDQPHVDQLRQHPAARLSHLFFLLSNTNLISNSRSKLSSPTTSSTRAAGKKVTPKLIV